MKKEPSDLQLSVLRAVESAHRNQYELSSRDRPWNKALTSAIRGGWVAVRKGCSSGKLMRGAAVSNQ